MFNFGIVDNFAKKFVRDSKLSRLRIYFLALSANDCLYIKVNFQKEIDFHWLTEGVAGIRDEEEFYL